MLDIGCLTEYNQDMKNKQSGQDEFYHIYNRGVMKREIFLDNRDYIRFLFSVLFFQSPMVTFYNMGREVTYFVKHRMFNIDKKINNVNQTKEVELVCFILMPNHFHLILRERSGRGITKYLQRLGNSYTKYFNIKYKQSGHLFQGPYQLVHIKQNEQLLYTSAYIHRNSSELKKWSDREHLYPWSSYADFIINNRWPKLLEPNAITEQFTNGQEYKHWVDTSGAKVKNFVN